MTLTNTGGEQRSDRNSLDGTSKAGSGSPKQAEGRISRAGAVVRLQLLNLSYDQHHIHTSSNIALVLLRDIKSTPVRIRRTVAYVRKVRNQLIVLNNYNRATYEAKGKYPYSKALILLLVRYVQLEYDVLYHQENYSAKYEEEVEEKVRYLLYLMLDGVARKYKRHNSDNAASECVLRVLNQVNTEFKIKGRFICSLINKLAKKLGLLETISELRQNGLFLSQNHPTFQKLSCESIEDISDCESDDASEIPTSPARSCASPFEKLKLESPKREPPDLDSGQGLQFLHIDDDYNSFLFPGLQRLKPPQKDVLLFGPKSENVNSNSADDSTDLITGHVNDFNSKCTQIVDNKIDYNSVAIDSTKNFKTRGDVKLNRGDEDATFGCSVYSNNNRSVAVDLPSFSDNKLTINDSHASRNRVGSSRTHTVVVEVINLVEDDDIIDLVESPNEKPTENNAHQLPPQDVSQEISPPETPPQEVSPQEVSPQEVSPQEVSPQEMSPQEVSPQEVSLNEVSPEQVPPEPPGEVKDISSLDDVQRDENDCFVIEHEEEILNKFIEEQINIEKDLTSDDQVNEISSTTGKEEIVFHNALEVADGLARIPVHTFVRRLTNSWRNAGKMNKPQPENVQVHALEDLTPETPDEVKTTSSQIAGEQRDVENDAGKVSVPRRNSLRISSELQGVLKVSEFLQKNIFEEAFERVLEATEKAQTLRLLEETPEDNFVVDLREESEKTEIGETDVDSQKRPTISVLNLSPGHKAISDQIFERTKTGGDGGSHKSRTVSPPILKAATLKLNRDEVLKPVSTIDEISVESKSEENMFKIRLPSAPTNELKPMDKTNDTRREGVGSDKKQITPKLSLPVPDVCLDSQNIEKSESRQSLPGKDDQIESKSNASMMLTQTLETNRDIDPRIRSQITNDKPKERKTVSKDDGDENLGNLSNLGDRIENKPTPKSDMTYLEPVTKTSNQKSSNMDVAQEKNEDSCVYLGEDPKFEERPVSFEESDVLLQTPNPPSSDCDDAQSPAIKCKVLSQLADLTTPVPEGKSEDKRDENSISSHPSEQSKTDNVRKNANQNLKPDEPLSPRNDLPQSYFKPSILEVNDASERAFEDVGEEPNSIITTCDNRLNSTEDVVGEKTTATLKFGKDADGFTIRKEFTPEFLLKPSIYGMGDSVSEVLENGRGQTCTKSDLATISDLTPHSANLDDLESTESVASELENVLASSHIVVNDEKISDDPDERGCLNLLSAELERILVDHTGEGDVVLNPSKSQHKCQLQSKAKLFEDETTRIHPEFSKTNAKDVESEDIQSEKSLPSSSKRNAKDAEFEEIQSGKSPLASSKTDAKDVEFEVMQSEKSPLTSSKSGKSSSSSSSLNSGAKDEATKSIQSKRLLSSSSLGEIKDAANKDIQSDKSPSASSGSNAKDARFEDIQPENPLPPSSKSNLNHEAIKNIQLERLLSSSSEVDDKDAASKYSQSDKLPLVSSKRNVEDAEFEDIQSEKSLSPSSKRNLKHDATKSIQLERSLLSSLELDDKDAASKYSQADKPPFASLKRDAKDAEFEDIQSEKSLPPSSKSNLKYEAIKSIQVERSLSSSSEVEVEIDDKDSALKYIQSEKLPLVSSKSDAKDAEFEDIQSEKSLPPSSNSNIKHDATKSIQLERSLSSSSEVDDKDAASKYIQSDKLPLVSSKRDAKDTEFEGVQSEKSLPPYSKSNLKHEATKSMQFERSLLSSIQSDTSADIVQDGLALVPPLSKPDDETVLGIQSGASISHLENIKNDAPVLEETDLEITIGSPQTRRSPMLNDPSPILNDSSPTLSDPSPILNDRETSEVALKSDIDCVSMDPDRPKRDVPSDDAIQNLHFQVDEGVNADNQQKELASNIRGVFDPESQQYYLVLDGEENAQIEFGELNPDIEKDENVLYILGSSDCEEVSFVIEGNEESSPIDQSELPKIEDGASSGFGNVEQDEGKNFDVGDGEYQYENDVPSVDNEVCLDYCEMQSSPSEGDDDVVLSAGTEEMEKVRNGGVNGGDVNCDDIGDVADDFFEKVDLESTNENVLEDTCTKSDFELEKPNVVPELDDSMKTDVSSEPAENPEGYQTKDILENQETSSEPQEKVVGSSDDFSAPSGIHPPKDDDLENERSKNFLENPNETYANFEPPQSDDVLASPEIYHSNHDTLETEFAEETPEDTTNDIIDNTGDGCSADVTLEEEPEDKNDNILEPDIILREIDTKLQFDAEPPKFSNYIPAHTEFCPIESPDQPDLRPQPIEVVPIAAITIASENYRQTFDVPLAPTTNKLDHPYENLQILATAAAAQRSLEIKAKSKRSRVKMAAKTHAKAQKKQEEEFQPNEVIETVTKQPVKTVYTTTTESDFNTVSEDSCDSFVGKLVIAEDHKVREQSPTEMKPAEIDISIFDEDTVDENLSFVPTTFEERDDVDLMEDEGHASFLDGVTQFNTDLDEEFDDGEVDDVIDVQLLGNYPQEDVTVQPSTSKAGSYVNTTVAENFKLKLPPTDYSIATILSLASTHEKIKQNQNLLKKIEGKFRKKVGKKLKKKVNKVGGGANVEGHGISSLLNREQGDNRVDDVTIATGDSQGRDEVVIEECQIAIGNQITIEQSQTSQNETVTEETKKPPNREEHIVIASSLLTDEGEILRYYTETQENTDSFVTANQTIGASLYEVRYDRENPLDKTDQQLVNDNSNRQPIRTKAELKAYEKKNHAMPQDKINLNSYVKLVRDPHMQQLIEKEYVEKRPQERKLEKITLGRKSYRNLLDARRLLLKTQPVQNQTPKNEALMNKKLENPKANVVVDKSKGNLDETKTNDDVKVSSPIKSESGPAQKFDEILIEKVDPKPKQDIINSSIDETIDEVVKSTEIETEIVTKARKVTRSHSIEITKLNRSETNAENSRTRSGNGEKAKHSEWMRGRRLIRSASVDAKTVENLFIESPRGTGRPKKTVKHDDLVVRQIETPKRELRSSRIDSGENTPLTSIVTRRSSRECRKDTGEHVDLQNQELSFKKARSKLSAIGTTIEEIVDEVVPSKRLSRSQKLRDSKELRDIIKVDEMMRMADIERKEKPKIEIEIIPVTPVDKSKTKSIKDGTGKKGMDLRRNSPAKRKRSSEDIQIDDECRKKADAETIKAKKSKKSMADEDQNLNKSNFEGNVNKLDACKAQSVAVKTQNLPDPKSKITTKAEMPDKWSPMRKGQRDQSKKINEEKEEEILRSDIPNENTNEGGIKKGGKLGSDIPSANKNEANIKKEEKLRSDIPSENENEGNIKKEEKLRSDIPNENKNEGNIKKGEKLRSDIPNENKDEENIKKKEENFDPQKIEVAAPKEIITQSENERIPGKPTDGGGSSDIPMNLRKPPQENLKQEQSGNDQNMSQVKEKQATEENKDDLHPEKEKTNDSGIKAKINQKEAENNGRDKSQLEEKPTAEENTENKEKIADLRTTFEEERRGERTESKELEKPKPEMKILPKTKKQRLLGPNRNMEKTVASDGGNEAKKLPIITGTDVSQNAATISRIASPKKLEKTAKESEILPEMSETTPENLELDTFQKEVEEAEKVEEMSKKLEVEETPKSLQVEDEKSEATPNELEIVAEKVKATPNNVEIDAEKVEATPNTSSEVEPEKPDETPTSSDIAVEKLEVTSKNFKVEVEKIKANPEDVVTEKIAPDPDNKVKDTNLSEPLKDSPMGLKTKKNVPKVEDEIAISKPPVPEKKKQEIAPNPQSTVQDPEGLDQMTSETIEAITLNMMLSKQLALRTEKLGKPVAEPKPAIKTYDRKSIIKKPQDCKNLTNKKKVTFNIQETSDKNAGSKIKFPKEMMVNTSRFSEQNTRSRTSPILLNETFKFHPQILNFEQRPLDLKITKDLQRPTPPQTNKFKRKLFDDSAETEVDLASKRPKIQDPKNEIQKLKCLVKDTLENSGEVFKNHDVATSPTKRKDIHTIVDNLRHNLDSKDSKEKAGNVKGWNNREEREKMIEVTVVEVIADGKCAKTGKRVEVGGVNTLKNTISNFKRKEEVKGIQKPRRLDDDGHSLLSVAYMAKSTPSTMRSETTITNKNPQKILPSTSGEDLQQDGVKILENSMGSNEKLPLKSFQAKGPRNSESMEVEICSVTTGPMVAETCEDATQETLKDVAIRHQEVMVTEKCEDATPKMLKDVVMGNQEVIVTENCDDARAETLKDVGMRDQEVMVNESCEGVTPESLKDMAILNQEVMVTENYEDTAPKTLKDVVIRSQEVMVTENCEDVTPETLKDMEIQNQEIMVTENYEDEVPEKLKDVVKRNHAVMVTENCEDATPEKPKDMVIRKQEVMITENCKDATPETLKDVIIENRAVTGKLETVPSDDQAIVVNEELQRIGTEAQERIILTLQPANVASETAESPLVEMSVNVPIEDGIITSTKKFEDVAENQKVTAPENIDSVTKNTGSTIANNSVKDVAENSEVIVAEKLEKTAAESPGVAVTKMIENTVTDVSASFITKMSESLVTEKVGTGEKLGLTVTEMAENVIENRKYVTENTENMITESNDKMKIDKTESVVAIKLNEDIKSATILDSELLGGEDESMITENNKHVLAENDGDVEMETVEEILIQNRETGATENGKSIVTESLKPAVTDSLKPAVTDSLKPGVTESLKPAVTEDGKSAIAGDDRSTVTENFEKTTEDQRVTKNDKKMATKIGEKMLTENDDGSREMIDDERVPTEADGKMPTEIDQKTLTETDEDTLTGNDGRLVTTTEQLLKIESADNLLTKKSLEDSPMIPPITSTALQEDTGSDMSLDVPVPPTQSDISKRPTNLLGISDSLPGSSNTAETARVTSEVKEKWEEMVADETIPPSSVFHTKPISEDADSNSNNSIKSITEKMITEEVISSSCYNFITCAPLEKLMGHAMISSPIRNPDSYKNLMTPKELEESIKKDNLLEYPLEPMERKMPETDDLGASNQQGNSSPMQTSAQKDSGYSSDSLPKTSPETFTTIEEDHANVNCMILTTSETPLEARIDSPPIGLEKTNSPLSKDVTNSTNSIREPSLKINHLKTQKDVSIFEEREKISDNLLLNFDHDDVDDNMPMAPPFPEITPGSMALSYSTPSTSLNKDLGLISCAANDPTMSDIMVSAASQMSNLIPNDITWTNVGVCDSFLLNDTFDQQSHNRGQDKIFSNRMKDEVIKMACAKPIEYSLPDPIEEHDKGGIDKPINRVKDESVLTLGGVKSGDFVENVLATSVPSSVVCGSTGLVPITTRIASFVTDQILTTSSGELNSSVSFPSGLTVNPESSNSDLEKDFEAIDEDNTPLSEKAKVYVTIQIAPGTASDHNYSMGGPLLGGKCENNDLPTKQLRQERDTRSSTDVPDNSPIETDIIFPFSEQVCINLIENNLAQETNRSLNQSPIDASADYQFSEQFAFMENQDASQQLHDNQININYIQMNLKQECDSEEDSNITSLIEEDFSNPMSVEKMNSIQLMHSSSQNRFDFPLANVDLADIERISFTGVTSRATQCGGDEDDILKDMKDRIKDIVCPENPQINKDDIISSVQTEVTSKNRRLSEKSEEPPAKKIKTDSSLTNFSSAMKAKAMADIERKKSENKQKEVHNSGYPIRQNNKTPVFAPIKNVSPSPSKKSPLLSKSRSNSSSPIVKSLVQTEEQMPDQLPLIEEKIIPGMESVATSTSDRPMTPPTTPINDEEGKYEIPADKLKNDLKHVVQAKISEMLTTFCTKSSNELPKLQIDSPNASTSSENFWGDKYDNIKRKRRQRPDRLIDTIALENLKKTAKIQSKQYYGREPNKPKTPLKSDQPKVKSLKLAKQDEDNLTLEEYKTFSDKCKLKGNLKGSNRSSPERISFDQPKAKSMKLAKQDEDRFKTPQNNFKEPHRSPERISLDQTKDKMLSDIFPEGKRVPAVLNRLFDDLKASGNDPHMPLIQKKDNPKAVENHNNRTPNCEAAGRPSVPTDYNLDPKRQPPPPPRKDLRTYSSKAGPSLPHGSTNLVLNTQYQQSRADHYRRYQATTSQNPPKDMRYNNARPPPNGRYGGNASRSSDTSGRRMNFRQPFPYLGNIRVGNPRTSSDDDWRINVGRLIKGLPSVTFDPENKP